MKQIDQNVRYRPIPTPRIRVLTFRVLCFIGFLLIAAPQVFAIKASWLMILWAFLCVAFILNFGLIKMGRGKYSASATGSFEQPDNKTSKQRLL